MGRRISDHFIKVRCNKKGSTNSARSMVLIGTPPFLSYAESNPEKQKVDGVSLLTTPRGS